MKQFLIVFLLAFSKISPAALPPKLKRQVALAETKYQIPEGLLDALITIESNYKMRSVNPKNFKKKVFVSSYGLGQLTYATAKAHCKLSNQDIFNTIKNIFCSVKVLKYQLGRFKSVLHAVSAYNLGTPCICDGRYYKRDINGKTVTCKKYDTGALYSCHKKDEGRFLNQKYVDDFITAHRKLYPNACVI